MKSICLRIDGEKLPLLEREKVILLALGKALIARGNKTSSCTQLSKLTGHNHNSISKMCWMLLCKKFVKLEVVYVKKDKMHLQARCFKLSSKGKKFFAEVFKEGKGKKEERSHTEPGAFKPIDSFPINNQ